MRALLNHDNGKTFEVIHNTINVLGYTMFCIIIKASDFNCPQHIPRLYMICFRNDTNSNNFKFSNPIPLTMTMSDVWEDVILEVEGMNVAYYAYDFNNTRRLVMLIKIKMIGRVWIRIDDGIDFCFQEKLF